MSEKSANPKSSGISKVTAPFYKILLVLLVFEYLFKANSDHGVFKIMFVCMVLIGLAQVYGIFYFFKNRKKRGDTAEL